MRDKIYWAIKGPFGFYTGTWHTRSEAIKEHAKAYLAPTNHTRTAIKNKWKERRDKGDRAVKVLLLEVT